MFLQNWWYPANTSHLTGAGLFSLTFMNFYLKFKSLRKRENIMGNFLEDGPKNPIKIQDNTFRDGHQSLLATRMRTEDMLPIAEKMDPVAGPHAPPG